MKKLLLCTALLFASLPLAFSKLVLLSSMLNECDEYWEVRVIEINEAGQIIKNDLIASGTYDHCLSLRAGNPVERVAPSPTLYLDKASTSTIQFNILPNPASTVRSIAYRAAADLQDAPTKIMLLDVQGKQHVIWQGALSGKEGQISPVDFQHLPDGNYFIVFQVEGLKAVSAQFVKYGK